MPNVTSIPLSSFSFADAPLFCANGDMGTAGRAVSVTADATVAVPGGDAMTVRPGGRLFKSESTGAVSFYDGPAFAAGFSRLLGNGTAVPLSESTAVQLLKVREAEDASHLKDIAALKGRAALDGSLKLARDIWERAGASETGQKVRDIANDAVAQGQAAADELRDRAREAAGSPTAARLVDMAKGARARLGKLAWGKLEKPQLRK